MAQCPVTPTQAYKYRYPQGQAGRLDRVMEAQGERSSSYRITKQADVLMLYHMLPSEEVHRLVAKLNPLDLGPIGEQELLRRNYTFYTPRTTMGPISAMIQSSVALRLSKANYAWSWFVRSAKLELQDRQKDTCEGRIFTFT